MRAAIERNAEGRRVGDAASADPLIGFDQRELPVGGGDAACRGDAGRAGANDHHINLAGGRDGAERRAGHGGGRS